MKTNRANYKTITKSRDLTIRTNLMEILQALTSQTKDDGEVIESLANIFASYRVRIGRTLAPVRLTSGVATRSLRRDNLGSRSAAWA